MARVLAGTMRRQQLTGPSGTADRASGVFKYRAEQTRSAGRRGRAKPSRSASSTTPGPAKRSLPASSAVAPLGRRTDADPPVLAVGVVRQGAQGRRQARAGFEQAGQGRPSLVIVHNPETHEVIAGDRARCTCGSPANGSPTGTASQS